MKIEIFGKTGRWYWRLRARNGRIVADGAESYTRRADCIKAATRVIASVSDCVIVVKN